MVGEAQLDWLVRGRKGNRPGLSPPLGTSSAESGGEAHKQEVAQGPWKGLRRQCLFHGKLLGMFVYNTRPKPLADPWFLFPPPLLSFLLSPGCVLPFGSQSQLPPGGLGGLSVPSRHITTSEGQPSLRSQPAGVTESARPPCWSLVVGAVL